MNSIQASVFDENMLFSGFVNSYIKDFPTESFLLRDLLWSGKGFASFRVGPDSACLVNSYSKAYARKRDPSEIRQAGWRRHLIREGLPLEKLPPSPHAGQLLSWEHVLINNRALVGKEYLSRFCLHAEFGEDVSWTHGTEEASAS